MQLNAIDKKLLEKVANLHETPMGAYNIRKDGQGAGRNTTANIDIITKKDKPGIDVIVKAETKNESVHIPVIVSKNINDVVYNTFDIGENSDVLVVAGKDFISGKTIDAIFPPIAYIIGNTILGLKLGIVLALSLAILLSIFRIFKKQTIGYVLVGILGVLVASGFALISNNAASYFLPKALSSGFLFLLSLLSILFGYPL